MSISNKVHETENGYLEVFTTQRTGTEFGYRIVGAKPGPQVVVAGHCTSTVKVFERLLAIPTLPWMRGNLVLIRLDALDDLIHDITSIASIGVVDRTVILADSVSEEGDEKLQRRNYHMILRTCSQMGMVAGRGVAAG
ncbi:hypothetical protein [Actibacterium pelagium]|uniref:Uncharacterized protein n=1 Tax=Actibacterium pelagium TaxID=2029103 RepID=A0A917EJF0_9RHOB|nr:hypothetical protein [Actibacterium pelagium]GGE48835.1 hypothetical protein GCM10011517_15880 [Actibacterium pelagium]